MKSGGAGLELDHGDTVTDQRCVNCGRDAPARRLRYIAVMRRVVQLIVMAGVPFGLLVALIGVLMKRPPEPDLIVAEVEGDVAEEVRGMDFSDMPTQARAFLASDRPWRAAQVMRAYLQHVPDAPADHRVLAARAEAGWGAWREVDALLENVPALDTHEEGIGLYLFARARDELGDAAGAVEAYRAFLALSAPAGAAEDERAAARLRLGLALMRAGDRAAGQREVQAIAAGFGGASLWLDLLRADALAFTGDTAAVRQAVAAHTADFAGLRAWRARIEAAHRAGDVAAARSLANQARAWARTHATRAEFLVAAGRAAVAMGDVARGRDAFRSAIGLGDAGPAARAAAQELLAGDMSVDDELAVARVLRAQGLQEESLDGYTRWIAARTGTPAERAVVHLEHANALFYAQRYDEVAAALRPIAGQASARMLQARAEAHRNRFDEAARIYLAVAEEHARTATGAQALYLAASVRHDEGDVRRARELYQRVISQYPGASQTGLSLMRLGGIAFEQGEYAEAARVWDGYRTRYPRGGSVLQATYWSGRARAAAGDAAGAATLFREVRSMERDSYYALRASEQLGVPFWPLPMSASPPDAPAAAQRVATWMQRVDLLRAAGFPDEASAEADRLVTEAGSDRATLYALAEALAERGYAQRAIRIAQRLRGSGDPDRRLLRVLFPFPYRTLITEESRTRSLDPFMTAALIRQESMFEARVTSPAGARGLMQIMPATGRRLADAAGLEPWDAELLYLPEVNVHLGTRYLAQHMENYDGSLPAVFSAYNAGSHRVAMWSNFAEYGDDELFTERIPFAETRGYVRILTRNRALYHGLYGGE